MAGLMASVRYESCIWGRKRTTGAFQGPSCAKVFPSAFCEALLHYSLNSKIFGVGTTPLGLFSPDAGGAVRKTLATDSYSLAGASP